MKIHDKHPDINLLNKSDAKIEDAVRNIANTKLVELKDIDLTRLASIMIFANPSRYYLFKHDYGHNISMNLDYVDATTKKMYTNYTNAMRPFRGAIILDGFELNAKCTNMYSNKPNTYSSIIFSTKDDIFFKLQVPIRNKFRPSLIQRCFGYDPDHILTETSYDWELTKTKPLVKYDGTRQSRNREVAMQMDKTIIPIYSDNADYKVIKEYVSNNEKSAFFNLMNDISDSLENKLGGK